MDKEETLKLLNTNLVISDIAVLHTFITEYLIEKNIELNRIRLFIEYISQDIECAFNNTIVKCGKYSINYFITKHGISKIIHNNQIIKYF